MAGGRPRLLTRTTPVFAEFVMIVVGGLKIGAINSLAALGIVVIYKATRIVNFAHGAFVLAGAYATYGVVEALASATGQLTCSFRLRPACLRPESRWSRCGRSVEPISSP